MKYKKFHVQFHVFISAAAKVFFFFLGQLFYEIFIYFFLD